MAILPLIQYPDPLLAKISQPIDLTNGVSKEIEELSYSMAESMYHYKGVGISAIQVGQPLRLIVYDVMQDQPKSHLNYLINPEMFHEDGTPFSRPKNQITLKGQTIDSKEGCLSVSFVFENVQRLSSILVKAYNLRGEKIQYLATGDEAICIQHEMDHLDGILFIDRMSRLKKQMALKNKDGRMRLAAKNMLTDLYVNKKSINLM